MLVATLEELHKIYLMHIADSGSLFQDLAVCKVILKASMYCSNQVP